MSCSSASLALVYFPSLHPDLAPVTPPAAIPFLDPGLADSGTPHVFRPTDLPLDDQELAGFVREFQRLQAEVKNPQDLALLAEASNGHFFADTTFAVRGELEDQLSPERVAKRRLVAAQLTLCLAFLLEKTLAKMASVTDMEARFRTAMADSLGLAGDADADDATLLGAAVSEPSLPSAAALAEEFGLPWRRMLSPFWAVLPASTGLLTADPEMLATWREAGLAVRTPSSQELVDCFGEAQPKQPVCILRETGWRLLGKTRPDAEAPWLDTPRTVVVLQP